MKVSSILNNKEKLETIIASSISKKQVLDNLGIKAAGGNYITLDKYIKVFNIDISHFLGSASNKGKVFDNQRKDALVHCVEGSAISSHKLKLLLVRDGYKKFECEECHLSHWHGEELPLELDHIDGNRKNNKLENLKILCPNCHAVKTRKQRQAPMDKLAKSFGLDPKVF